MRQCDDQYNPAKPHHTPDGFKNSDSDRGKGVDFNFTPVQHRSARGLGNLTGEPLSPSFKDLALALSMRGLAPDTFTVMAMAQTHVLPARPSP